MKAKSVTAEILAMIANWFTGVVAAFALFFAARAANAAKRTDEAQRETLDLQRKQYAASREDLRRAQASKVTYWVYDSKVCIINASESPIYNVN